MKLVYLIPALYNAGGSERVLHNKVCWFVRRGGYDITIITTDQGNAPLFFEFPKSVHIIDLNINYSSVYSKTPLLRWFSIYRKKKLHLKRLSDILCKIQPDVTITMYPCDTVSLKKIKDGSKKILEFHNSRYLRLHQGRKGIHQIIAMYRTYQDYLFVKKFDELIVLTNEGASQWSLPKMKVIPNAALSAPIIPKDFPNRDSKRIIAVGRLVYEKGFDRLIKAWGLLPEPIRSEWRLDIFGSGEQLSFLQTLINQPGLSSISIKAPTKQVFEEYLNSAFLVMTSYSEGLPMVLIEAMSYGLPAICFDFPCGPKDVINDGVNGFLVKNGDIKTLSQKIQELICNKNLLKSFSEEAKLIRNRFSEETIMEIWEKHFEELMADNKK